MKKKIIRIVAIVLAVVLVGTGTVAFVGSGIFNKYVFSIDASQQGRALPNVVNNVNVWSIEGNPFTEAKRNPDNDIFEFVEFVQIMLCSGGTEA